MPMIDCDTSPSLPWKTKTVKYEWHISVFEEIDPKYTCVSDNFSSIWEHPWVCIIWTDPVCMYILLAHRPCIVCPLQFHIQFGKNFCTSILLDNSPLRNNLQTSSLDTVELWYIALTCICRVSLKINSKGMILKWMLKSWVCLVVKLCF